MIDNSKILKELKSHLKNNFGDSVKDVILFGSKATGKSNEYSDFDILILLKRNYTGKEENIIFDLCYDINLKFDIVIDVHILSQDDLSTLRGRQKVFSNAIKSGIYA